MITEITNKYGKKIFIGQKCVIARQFSNKEKESVVTKISAKFVYADGQKFCINKLSKGRIGNVVYITLK
jgi:hypothetical protein